MQKRSQEGEKRDFFQARAEYYLQPNTSLTQLDDIAHEQTITWRQLFAGHVLGFQPIKRKQNLHLMIRWFIYSLESLEQLLTCGFSRVSRYKTSLSYRLIWDELHQQNISWRTQRGGFGVSTESTQACVVCPLAVKYFHIVIHTACRTWEK